MAGHPSTTFAPESLNDFVLYSSHSTHGSYSDILDQDSSRHEEPYTKHFSSNMSNPYSRMTAYDSYDPINAYSSAQQPFYDTPRFVLDAPQDGGHCQRTPSGSPATSASQSFDPPPSTLSSASGASIQSASSSAMGSPYSRASQILPGAEPWADPSKHGLGIGPSIVQNDNFEHETSIPASLEHELMFTDNKVPSGFVGNDFQAISSSFPSSQSLVTASAPALVVNTTMAESGVTIDSILDEVNSDVTTPKSSISPSSAISATASHHSTSSHQATKEHGHFRSPTVPASIRATLSPISYSPVTTQRRDFRRSSLGSAGARKWDHSPSVSPKPSPSAKSSAQFVPLEPTQGPQFPYTSPFFVQSSGNFVAPLQSSYPSLIQPFQTSAALQPSSGSYPGEMSFFQSPQVELHQPPSPVPSNSSDHSQRRSGSATIKCGSQSPYLHTQSYQPYPQHQPRRPSVVSTYSRNSQGSPRSGSYELDEEGREKGRCHFQDCGKVFKDLKAHMLTHQSERPEKCPIVNCDYHIKGFARKYDKNRHTLTHYKGTMVCGFCPGSGSAAEKSFNRADVFKRHLTSVHGVEQTPPNSRKKTSASASMKTPTYPQDATGICSTCSLTFSNAQEFYEHLDDCVLRVVQQEEPSEANNERHLASIENDDAVRATMGRHALPMGTEYSTQSERSIGEEDEDDDNDEMKDNEDDDAWTLGRTGVSNSGKGAIKTTKSNYRIGSKGIRQGLTYSKGGVPLMGKGRKKRKNYPLSWGCSAEKMKMKKRVLCVYDGARRLWKDDMMLDNEFEVRLKLGDGRSYVTDLDVETLKRAEAFHGATEEEKGPYVPEEIDIQELMS
ncbi:MAG: hypothetical protein M1835_001166 [Candelina submexicana]|nr:MAG: hypothetical protein M1835_001166 [Candelina submexicana]